MRAAPGAPAPFALGRSPRAALLPRYNRSHGPGAKTPTLPATKPAPPRQQQPREQTGAIQHRRAPSVPYYPPPAAPRPATAVAGERHSAGPAAPRTDNGFRTRRQPARCTAPSPSTSPQQPGPAMPGQPCRRPARPPPPAAARTHQLRKCAPATWARDFLLGARNCARPTATASGRPQRGG